MPHKEADALTFPTLGEMTDPQAILGEAVRRAAELAGPKSRAVYFVVRGDVASVLAEFDPSGRHAPPFVWLDQHPALAEAVRTGLPVGVTFSKAELAPSIHDSLGRMHVSQGAALPIFAWGQLHGVLAIGGRDRDVEADDRLVALGHAVERALDPARTAE